MQLRKLSPKTQSGYIRNIKKLADHLRYSPHAATAEELRQYQLSLVNNGTARIAINTALTAIRFLFNVTLDKPERVSFFWLFERNNMIITHDVYLAGCFTLVG